MNDSKPDFPKPDATPRNQQVRFSPQLVMMVMISLLALALPLTVLSIGLVKMNRQKSPVAQPQPAPEAPGLRAILERVADDKLSPKGLPDGRGQAVIVDNPENWTKHRLEIEETAKSLGGTVLSQDQQNAPLILVQIPIESANRFQASVLGKAVIVSEPARTGTMLIYQIRFQK